MYHSHESFSHCCLIEVTFASATLQVQLHVMLLVEQRKILTKLPLYVYNFILFLREKNPIKSYKISQ